MNGLHAEFVLNNTVYVYDFETRTVNMPDKTLNYNPPMEDEIRFTMKIQEDVVGDSYREEFREFGSLRVGNDKSPSDVINLIDTDIEARAELLGELSRMYKRSLN